MCVLLRANGVEHFLGLSGIPASLSHLVPARSMGLCLLPSGLPAEAVVGEEEAGWGDPPRVWWWWWWSLTRGCQGWSGWARMLLALNFAVGPGCTRGAVLAMKPVREHRGVGV